ncbi:MAG TPA: TonB-dependent receptor, partial [Longimicrobiales bacterium]|nr:TonB-dependent receptor [Longimicrobiales bacterium]
VLVDNPLIREQAFGDGRYRNLSWNVRGGGERFGAFLSLGADDDDGTLPNNHYGHVSGSAAFDYFVNEKLRIETDFRLGQTSTQLPRNDNDIYGYLGGGLLGDPRTRGAPKDGWYGNNRQTLAISAYENVDKTMRIQPRVSVSYTPWQWFTHRVTAGGDLSRIKAYSFWAKNDIGWWDDAPRNTGRIGEARRSIDRYTVDYLGTVTRQLASELRADVSFGSQLQTRKQDTVDSEGTGLINNDVRTVNAAAQLTGGGQTVSEDRQIGFFTQAQFAWKEKIYFVAGGRVDQLSSFGADSKPFYSPKVGVSYVISDEPFFRSAISEAAISALRLRAAYGVTGRSPTSGARTTFSPTTNQITATTVGIGVLPDDIGNPTIRAEKGKELELGFEAGLLRDRLGLELTYFHKKSLDAILEQPIPGSQGLGGTSGPLVNVGAILNKGFELAANARVLTMENVSLELRGAVNTLHNELLDLGGTPATTTRKEGFPLSGQWDYRIRKVDLATNTVTVSDTLEFIGNSPNLPEWESTASATLTLLRNISFYAQFDGRGGVVQYDNTAQFRDRQNGFTAANVNGPAAYGANPDGTPTDAAKEKWMRKFGCIAPCPHPGAWMTETWTDSTGAQRGGRTLSRTTVRGDYIQDAGFIRLREVSVSYSLPRDIVSRYLRAQSLRLTVGMRNNLKTWTDFEGLDPESDQFLTVPADRRWTARLNFTF